MRLTEYLNNYAVTNDMTIGFEFIILNFEELQDLNLPVNYENNKEYGAIFYIYRRFVTGMFPDYDPYKGLSSAQKVKLVSEALNKSDDVIAKINAIEI